MKLYKIHLVLGLVWLLAGMSLGEIMGRTGDHTQMPTHAHTMLVGGVLSILWALLYRLLALPAKLIAGIQLLAHHAGAAIMIIALYMLFGGQGSEATLGPVLGIAGGLVMLSVLLMLFQVIRAKD